MQKLPSHSELLVVDQEQDCAGQPYSFDRTSGTIDLQARPVLRRLPDTDKTISHTIALQYHFSRRNHPHHAGRFPPGVTPLSMKQGRGLHLRFSGFLVLLYYWFKSRFLCLIGFCYNM